MKSKLHCFNSTNRSPVVPRMPSNFWLHQQYTLELRQLWNPNKQKYVRFIQLISLTRNNEKINRVSDMTYLIARYKRASNSFFSRTT